MHKHCNQLTVVTSIGQQQQQQHIQALATPALGSCWWQLRAWCRQLAHTMGQGHNTPATTTHPFYSADVALGKPSVPCVNTGGVVGVVVGKGEGWLGKEGKCGCVPQLCKGRDQVGMELPPL